MTLDRYNSDHFNEKNLENLHQDIKDVITTTKNKLLLQTFSHTLQNGTSTNGTKRGSVHQKKGNSRNTKMRAESVGSQFKTSLSLLISTLTSTNPNYIRCLKPNHEKKASLFHAEEVLRQLK